MATGRDQLHERPTLLPAWPIGAGSVQEGPCRALQGCHGPKAGLGSDWLVRSIYGPAMALVGPFGNIILIRSGLIGGSVWEVGPTRKAENGPDRPWEAYG